VRRAFACSALAALAAVGAACGGSTTTVTATETTVRTTTVTEAAAAPSPATSGASIPDVIAKVLRGVVNVKTVGYDGSKGEGSGVVIDRAGVIVTNNHVVRGARTVTVAFNDGRHQRPVRARVVGTAAERDLAIIRVTLQDLVPVPLGRSGGLRLGDGVLAIGFPLGLSGGPTVTQGIVSGLHRTVPVDSGPTLQGLLQTAAAINPGNSGGALVDLSGRLVGINTAAARAENVGFAIAIDEARTIIGDIRSKPADQRVWLGATLGAVDSSAAAVQIGLPPETRGAAVITLFAGGPAAKGGMREGDVIVGVGGRTVRSTGDVDTALRGRKVGGKLVLDVVDSSGPRRVTVTLARRPATVGG
jgi:putative serine protease PepD